MIQREVKDLSSKWRLYNGVEVPCVGFGTWKMPDTVVEQAVCDAIESGYRHIDTAAAYQNERGVGKGVRMSGFPREEIFVASKLPNADHGYKKALESYQQSLERLEMDHLDLYMIHWPVIEEHKDRYKEDILETWSALEELYDKGKVRAIGVSNFMMEHLELLAENGRTKPMVDQVQFNPQCTEPLLRAYCEEREILMEGWSPLIQGKAFEHKVLQDMAEKYGKTIAQICVRFVLQHGVVPIPKSANLDRIRNNGNVFGFSISDRDMEEIAKLSVYGRIGEEPDIPRKFQNVGF
ncbi:aldo/keto reductase [Anaerotalea alkaliphila]|uniref:Aldo/keto reductase n=1 Tax=Anaerotalea alkaliphila TaxID=2662126 RepID=A0A7X5KL52_9FIRM|nr:aldo/keto reductase [Anaerotalea alkaliphila]NDL66466.1 aldo/keto reductase [Anaerotalea alkaliphila]